MNYYRKRQDEVRQEAIEWQFKISEDDTWYDAIGMQYYFEKLGKRYGLLEEFRENGII